MEPTGAKSAQPLVEPQLVELVTAPLDLRAGLGIFERIRVVMVNVATVTCEKCGRRWHEPILEKCFINHYGKICFAPTVRTTPWCSHCSLPSRQPEEGDLNRNAMGRGGFVQIIGDGYYYRSRTDKKARALVPDSSAFREQERLNRESQEREKILTPGWIREQASPGEIRRVSRLLTQSPRAKLVRMYPELSDYVVRAGKTEHVLALLEAAARA